MTREEIISFTEESDLEAIADQAAAVLRGGGVLLTPTDTVYGLVCLPTSGEAVRAIFDMKQRPSNWRLPIIAANQEQAERELPLLWTPGARSLARAFWPGALTIAFGVRENAPDWLAGRDEAAVRVPDYPFIRILAEKTGPFLMTSANRHGEKTPHTVAGALRCLAAKPALALDGGTLRGTPSTLVNVHLPAPVVEREGSISNAEIERVLCLA